MQIQIQYRDNVDSTNLWAKELAEAGAAEGTLLVADRQSDGRGRRGRSWSSPAGESIYMSLILRPEILPEQASMLTLVMGLSVVQACRQLYGLDAWIKWPNDMVIGGKKVCGILTEMSVSAEEIQYVVVGIGINVNGRCFEPEIADTASSLFLECLEKGQIPQPETTALTVPKIFPKETEGLDRNRILAAVMESFAENYKKFLEGRDLRYLQSDYNQMLINVGKEVRVLEPSGEYRGISSGINEKGELLVTKEDGTCTPVYAGEVSVRGVYGYV